MHAKMLSLLGAAWLMVGHGPAMAQAPGDQFAPPWQHGANNDAVNRGVEFTVPQIDVLADFHGDLTDPRLVLYVGGNYFFVMAPLVKAFEEANPAYKGRLYWETIPPGLLVEQIKSGGRITSGNMTWTARGDVYFAGLGAVNRLIDEHLLTGPAIPYVTNTLTIMVRKGNPKGIASLADLARSDVRLAMPNPAFEGIARQIREALVKAGGEALAKTVYDAKVADGSAMLTHIHHRQTPLFLMQGVADAGVTWQSEALFQEQVGNPIAHVDIPSAGNVTETYGGAMIAGAPHPEAAQAWLTFIRSPQAMAIFARYGFKPVAAAISAAP
jgi:molybdate transport system substrate-binding protein